MNTLNIPKLTLQGVLLLASAALAVPGGWSR